jgi:hypothetical protein
MVSKEHIVSEIRRTAEENGGVPLGTARFAAETGIRETDWSGKYWVRWGDALVEAGYAPNEFRSAYPDEYLLDKLAALTKELRHFPLVREIKIQSRRDPGFPAEQAFRRLGNKKELAAKLVAFCVALPGYENVVDIATPHAMVQEESKLEQTRRVRVVGEVYLIKSGKFYKIGKTNSVGRREYELTIQLPQKAKLVHAIKTDDPSGIENYWHRRFRDKRTNGEWFELTPEDVSAFKWRKFM